MRRPIVALAALTLAIGAVIAAPAHADEPVGWDEHVDSFILNGEPVHVPHTHPTPARYVMPPIVEGERLIVVERIAGVDRYHTAVLVSQLADIGIRVAFVVNGQNPVDALPAAATGLGPVFYVPPTGVAPPAVVQELYHLQPDVILVIGGPTVISDSVLLSLAVVRP